VPRRLLLVLAVLLFAAAPALYPRGYPPAGPGRADQAAGRPAPAVDLPPAFPDSLFAPLDRPGPTFDVPGPALAASLRCTVPPPVGPPRDPVLLLSSTGVDTPASFDWNYQPALSAAGITWCTSNAPGENNGDIQVRAEYVAYAVRELRAWAGRTVDVIGHGQGALAARMALRFWPDLRDDVSDLIGLAPPNRGTAAFDAACERACPAAYWQQRPGSMLVSAVNSRQRTFPGVDYTVITSTIDEVITTEPAASSLGAGPGRVSAVAVQDVCPGYVADHLGIGGYDAVAWAIASDALNNPGPADPARVNRAVCHAGFMPTIDSEQFLDNAARAAMVLEPVPPPNAPTVPAEPAPRCWVLAGGCLTGVAAAG
jgi:hypothetical protein